MVWWVSSESFRRLHYIIVADSSQFILAPPRAHHLSVMKLFGSGSIRIRWLILSLSLQVTGCSHNSWRLIKNRPSAWGEKLHIAWMERTINHWVTFNPYLFNVAVVLFEPIVPDQEASSDGGWLMAPWIYGRPSVQRHSAAVASPPVSVACITTLLWVHLCRLSVKNFQIAFGNVQSLSPWVDVDVWKNLCRKKKNLRFTGEDASEHTTPTKTEKK